MSDQDFDATAFLGDLRQRVRSFAKQAAGELSGLKGEPAARAALASLAKADWLRFVVAKAHGGQAPEGLTPKNELSVRVMCVLREELAYAHGLLDLMFVMQGLGSYPLLRDGSLDLRSAILPGVHRGERIASYGLTEPGAGSSLDEIATSAVQDGDEWVLNGHKTFISNAGIADFVCVLARTAGKPGDRRTDGLTMFYVPTDSGGVRMEPFEVLGDHPIGDVIFDNVRVRASYLLGQPGAGLEIALATLARFRTTVASAACGFARRALDESCGHLARREQFGKPLSANQGLRFDLAEMDTRLRASELLVEEAARLSDANDPAAAQAVARAKLFATEEASWICDRAVQHHGGLGVKQGTVVEALYRETRALRIYEGASEVQKLILSKIVLSADAERRAAEQATAQGETQGGTTGGQVAAEQNQA